MSTYIPNQLDAVYSERNQVALAFAYVAGLLGWPYGRVNDAQTPGWPLLFVDTPCGQVSWHLPEHEMPNDMPAYRGTWDGHDTPTKYARLALLATNALTGMRGRAEWERNRDGALAEIQRLTNLVEQLREQVDPRVTRRAELAEEQVAAVTRQLDRAGAPWPGTWPWERVKQLVDEREACPACNPADEGLVDRAYALFTARYREEFPRGGDEREHEQAQHAAMRVVVAALRAERAGRGESDHA